MKKFISAAVLFVLLTAVFGVETVSAQKKFKRTTSKSSWSGVWKVPSRYRGSVLTIKKATARGFYFELAAINGANMGDIDGYATIAGKKAFYDDRKAKVEDSEKHGCQLTFTHKGAFIDVEQNDDCVYYAGSGVYFASKYYKGNVKVEESNFVVLEVFPNAAVDRKFKRLVGAKEYERFLDSFHLSNEEENLDDFSAKTFSACVQGMCPWWAAIIMYDDKGDFWAAVVNDKIPDKVFVNYYTNVSAWSGKLPKTIENWVADKRKSSDNLMVVYKNK